MHDCVDFKRRTKATCDSAMQGTIQNYLHKLTACRLAAILQNLELSSSKSTFDCAWKLHQGNPTPIEWVHFQQYRERLMSLRSTTAEVLSVDNFEWRNRVSRPLPFIKSPWTNTPVCSIWIYPSVHMYFTGPNSDG